MRRKRGTTPSGTTPSGTTPSGTTPTGAEMSRRWRAYLVAGITLVTSTALSRAQIQTPPSARTQLRPPGISTTLDDTSVDDTRKILEEMRREGKLDAEKADDQSAAADENKMIAEQEVPQTPAGSAANAAVADARHKRDIWSLDYEKRIYEWQFFTTKIVFIVVIGLVLAGVFFSWTQFQYSLAVDRAERRARSRLLNLNRRKAATKAAAAKATRAVANETKEADKDDETKPADTSDDDDSSISNLDSELEASLSGLKVKTSMLGVLILTISFLFFYLFLQVVYPIK
jgi:hypothetical protein